MKTQMINDPSHAEPYFSLIRDCSHMDSSLVERLYATAETSLGWADQMLDVLIQLDDDLKDLEATVKRQVHCLPLPGTEEIAHQTEQSVQHLRSGVRDVMMSMQQQDVIGQAIGRAAAALEKRAAALGRAVEGQECSDLHTGKPMSEVAEIHRLYRTDDDLHRAVDGERSNLDAEEYKAAA